MQADWELCKENFQPLKRGRKEVCKQESKVCQKGDVDSQRRCAGFCKDQSAVMHMFSVVFVCRAFLQELETYSGEDPLDGWVRSGLWPHDRSCLPIYQQGTSYRVQVHQVDAGYLSKRWTSS